MPYPIERCLVFCPLLGNGSPVGRISGLQTDPLHFIPVPISKPDQLLPVGSSNPAPLTFWASFGKSSLSRKNIKAFLAV
jgi:hypothetical protein